MSLQRQLKIKPLPPRTRLYDHSRHSSYTDSEIQELDERHEESTNHWSTANPYELADESERTRDWDTWYDDESIGNVIEDNEYSLKMEERVAKLESGLDLVDTDLVDTDLSDIINRLSKRLDGNLDEIEEKLSEIVGDNEKLKNHVKLLATELEKISSNIIGRYEGVQEELIQGR